MDNWVVEQAEKNADSKPHKARPSADPAKDLAFLAGLPM